jgi:hypothetical protein
MYNQLTLVIYEKGKYHMYVSTTYQHANLTRLKWYLKEPTNAGQKSNKKCNSYHV